MIFFISLFCARRLWERFLFMRNVFKFLNHVESKRSQFEISLSRQHALIKTQFTVKESFKLSLAGSKGYTFSITSSFLCNDNSQRTVKGNSVRCKNELFSC